ncbi:uncharacterized protein B0P05DRAFT_530395 [Gilbertella persicaria]|uniref:uncharacterized protein n=1 Tax=Gilbertella persicaria TaxID=101096 RepID=UPI00222074A7|nr:uncharacterized protein B0P05DRAFT_530395 [Gilbertella persicaria]KAI8087854.1 hypothetical protein B0P05DRAFT_530395 [Gilbertella persicaria]
MPPEKPLYTNEESNRPQIRILGVPSTGAKSRVETQIKLCIQLMTKDEKKVVDWSYIRLGENMLARSRLRKSQQQVKPLDGSIATMVSDESKVLQLEAKVICASSSNTDHPVRMCVGCVRRERKRAERTKDGKSKDLVVLSQDMEAERDRILLFNCNPMINFSSGDAILPTRITCYCRHHNEKEGFRICFAMKNHQGHVVATGISPPIMITDDHKSSKQKNSRKRSRDENTHIISRPDTPAPSRRGSMSTGEEKNTLTSLSLEDGEDSEEEQGLSTPTSLEFMQPGFNLAPQPTPSEEWPFNRRRRTIQGYTSSDASANALINSMLDRVPQLERLVPSQGPTYGGIEVTLLGSGFYRGLTCLFGEHAATTVYWNANTMVCLLPPAAQTGPVVVSFKEHPLVLEGQDVAIFTYYDASDHALLELALQVVGLKMTGKLHDAKHVAMRIVQGGDQQNSSYQSSVLEAVEQSDQLIDYTQTNNQGHTLLHLAVLLNNEALVRALIASYQYRPAQEKLAFLNTQDKNNMTALHLACQSKSRDLVRVLLYVGASSNLQSNWGLPSSLCQEESDLLDLLDLYNKNNSIRRKPLSRRNSHMSHRFHSLSSTDSIKVIVSPSMELDGLGFVRHKLNCRLYLFWVPMFIGKFILLFGLY